MVEASFHKVMPGEFVKRCGLFLFLSPVILLLLAGPGFVRAQTAQEANSGSRLEWDAANSIWRFKWWAKAGNAYFIQHSEDLQQWSWAPVVQAGDDSIKEWDFTSAAGKFFVRLRYTDVLTGDPEGGDFDGDGISNLAEVQGGGNPFDYYDQAGVTVTPALEIVSGNDQTGAPDAFAAGPLVVKVTNAANGQSLSNAPIAFSVVGGAEALAQSPSELAQFFSTLTLRSDPLTGEISNLQDKVHVRLPSASSSSLQITAAAATSQSGILPVQFTVYNYNPFVPPVAPGSLSVIELLDYRVQLTWTDLSDNETGFIIQRSDDGGLNWTILEVLGANTESYIVDSGSVGAVAAQFRVTSINNAGSSPTLGAGSTPDPNEDFDDDTLKNSEEAFLGTDPRSPQKLPPQYVIIDLSGEEGIVPVGVNDIGEVALAGDTGNLFRWTSGNTESLQMQNAGDTLEVSFQSCIINNNGTITATELEYINEEETYETPIIWKRGITVPERINLPAIYPPLPDGSPRRNFGVGCATSQNGETDIYYIRCLGMGDRYGNPDNVEHAIFKVAGVNGQPQRLLDPQDGNLAILGLGSGGILLTTRTLWNSNNTVKYYVGNEEVNFWPIDINTSGDILGSSTDFSSSFVVIGGQSFDIDLWPVALDDLKTVYGNDSQVAVLMAWNTGTNEYSKFPLNKWLSLRSGIADWEINNIHDANRHGVIAAKATKILDSTSHAVLLVPAEFKLRDQSKINEGWDPPIAGDVHADGSKDEDDWAPWTIVAKNHVHGQFNRNELTKIVLPSDEIAQMFELAVADDSQPYIEINEANPGQPIALTQKETPITIVGKNTDPTLVFDSTIELRLKNDPEHKAVLKMRVKTVPDLEPLALKFYAVEDSRFLSNTPSPGYSYADSGTEIRTDPSVAGGMYAEIQARFLQSCLSFSFAGTAEHRDVPYLKSVPQNPSQVAGYPSDLENNDAAWVRAKFPALNFNEGHIRTILVHTLNEPVGYYDPVLDVSFIGVDTWYQTLTDGAVDRPFYMGQNETLWEPENAKGQVKSPERVSAHEAGHALDLAARAEGDPDPDGFEGGHDSGPYPASTVSLMHSYLSGRWLRHEDWDVAVRKAMDRLGN